MDIPGPTKPPFPAYRGNEPYIFVSYAHADKAVVYPEIRLLHERGCRIWFDEGITPGEKWTREIARAIERCRFFMLFMTPRAAGSEWVYREIEFAVAERRPFLAIYLEQTALSAELRWLIGPVQAILKHDIGHVTYLAKLRVAIPEETISSPESSPADEVPTEKPAKPKATIRVKSADAEPVKESALQETIGASPTSDSSLDAQLLEASGKGELATVWKLLAKGADPNAHRTTGRTALMETARLGYLEVTRLLLEKGADLCARESDGWTALIYAAWNGHLDVARVLLEKGADPNAFTTDTRTPLMLAAALGHLRVAQLLLEKGADPWRTNGSGQNALDLASSSIRGELGNFVRERFPTALHKWLDQDLIDACCEDAPYRVTFLLDKGADLNATHDGRTALMWAALKGHLEVARILLSRGADPLLKDSTGLTALDIADRSIQPDLVRIIFGHPKI